jgi:hypothetical protein
MIMATTFKVKGNEMMLVSKILALKRISEIGFILQKLSPMYRDLVRTYPQNKGTTKERTSVIVDDDAF